MTLARPTLAKISKRRTAVHSRSLCAKYFFELHGSHWKPLNIINNLGDVIVAHGGKHAAGKPCSIDFAVGLVGHPLFVAALLVRIYGPSTFSQKLLVAFNVVISFLCGASFFTITAIGVDSLLALKLHLRYQALVTRW